MLLFMYYKSLYLKSNLNMAEKKKNSNSNNINLKFLINAQYLKDLSFENPQAPDSLKNVKSNPRLKLMLT